MDICFTNNHLLDFSFVSLIRSESEVSVKLHPKLKLTNILKFKGDMQRFFTKLMKK